jgi:hypothetical protein
MYYCDKKRSGCECQNSSCFFGTLDEIYVMTYRLDTCKVPFNDMVIKDTFGRIVKDKVTEW